MTCPITSKTFLKPYLSYLSHMQDPLSLDIPFTPAQRHRRRSLESPLRSTSGVLDSAAAQKFPDAADRIEISQQQDAEQSSSFLQLRRTCSPCQSEVYVRASRSNLQENDKDVFGTSLPRADSVHSSELQRAATTHAAGSGESLDSLTSMCQKWLSFSELPPLSRCSVQPFPLAGQRKACLPQQERCGVRARDNSTAAKPCQDEPAEVPGCFPSRQQCGAFPLSINANRQLPEVQMGAQCRVSRYESDKGMQNGQLMSAESRASLPVQRRARIHLAGDSARARDRENLPDNTLQSNIRQRIPQSSWNSSGPRPGAFCSTEAGDMSMSASAVPKLHLAQCKVACDISNPSLHKSLNRCMQTCVHTCAYICIHLRQRALTESALLHNFDRPTSTNL